MSICGNCSAVWAGGSPSLSGAEAGLVTAGVAAAMATATAACMAGTDTAKIWQLPDTSGMKNEVIMFGGRISFDSAIRAAGAKLVVVHSHDELKAAFNDNTAMVYTTARGDRLEKAIPMTKGSALAPPDEAAFKMNVQECAKKLRDGSPRIEVLTENNPSTVPGVHEGDPKTPRPIAPTRCGSFR